MRKFLLISGLVSIVAGVWAQTPDSIRITDLYKLRAAGDPQLSPDGVHAAFTVQYADRPGFPYTRIWLADLATGSSAPISEPSEGSSPRWSPDGTHLAFFGAQPDGSTGLVVTSADGTSPQRLATVQSSNHPWPMVGNRLAWSPDGQRLAFVSATPGPEPDMNGDPIVITRYWFRPATSAGGRFSDNRRLHIFLVDMASRQTQQLTDGTYTEHSIQWTPDGKHISFLSDHEADPDFVFNYDIFTVDPADKRVKPLTQTKSNEFAPVWSPNGATLAYFGLKRDITSSETNMEDTHVWTLDPATGSRHETGIGIDNRQSAPLWSPDGQWLYFTVQSHGSSELHRIKPGGLSDEIVARPPGGRGEVTAFSVGKNGLVLACMSSATDLAELYVIKGGKAVPLTALNKEALAGRYIAPVEAFTFHSMDGLPVEAFLTVPADLQQSHPLIVMIHGGPHGQQGPAFNHRAQAYAGHGYAVMMVNYRGSTGYGQAFANAIANDQNGKEAQDVLIAVDSALARYPWIDRHRLGVEGQSYGGQLSNWLVTQTDRFAAAIPAASISNLVSHNYMSVYHDYLQQEYGVKPHIRGVVDSLWERSAIRIVYKVKTPVMFIHGDNDQLVNPAEIEQYYIALKDVGVETRMVRYPREGHGIRESKHLVDIIGRSMAWYDVHFAGNKMTSSR